MMSSMGSLSIRGDEDTENIFNSEITITSPSPPIANDFTRKTEINYPTNASFL